MPTSHDHARHPAPRRATRVGASIGLAIVMLLSACGGDGDGPLSGVTLPGATTPEGGDGTNPPEQTDPPEQTNPPEQTDPPEQTNPPEQTSPPEPEPEPEPEDDGGLSTEAIILLALIGIGLLVALLAIKGKNSKGQPASSGGTAQPNRTADLVAGCRWVHDQGSMEILRTSDPAQLSHAWQVLGGRMIELEGRAGALASGSADSTGATALLGLQRSMAALRGSLESDVALRTDAAMVERLDLVQASAHTVQQRRMDLDVALASPTFTMQ